MFRQVDASMHVAQRVRREVRSGHSIGAIWFELFKLDRDAALAGWVEGGGSLTASAGEAAGKRLASDSGAWVSPRVRSAAVHVPRLLNLVRTWLKRHRSRRELLNYIAQDHRAAADMGTTRTEAEGWARQPFWRP